MSYQSNYFRKKFQELRNYYGNKCFFCGQTYRLEFAHKRPTKLNGKGRGRQERYYDIKNNLDCYMLTCSKHNYLAEVIL